MQSYCRPCAAERRRVRYKADPGPRRAEALGRYRAKKAANLITPEAKAAKRAYDRLYRLRRSEHINAIKADWREKNADLVRAIKSTYKAKRRVIEAQGDSSATIKKWLAQQVKSCLWCGADCSTDYHIDHVQPLSKGGQHVVANLCISCPTCNVRKNAKDPAQWLQEIAERHRCDVGMI